MKIKGFIAIVNIAILCILTLYSGISHSEVYGGKHDLSLSGTGFFQYDTVQVCVFCHTPHGANTNVRSTAFYNASGYNYGSGEPFLLWNRGFSAQPSAQLYSSNTMDVPSTELRAYSLLCLSCHDGVSAMNVLTNYPSEDYGSGPPPQPLTDTSGGGDQMSDTFFGDLLFGWGPNIGDRTALGDPLNLANDHPISFDYPDASHPDVIAGGLMKRDGNTGYVYNATDPVKLKLFPTPSDTTKIISMECSTCHNVHNEGADGLFLAISNDNSALCTHCHIK